jgi:carbonic anhydrase
MRSKMVRLLAFMTLVGCDKQASDVDPVDTDVEDDTDADDTDTDDSDEPPEAHWSYDGETGPEHWGDLSDEWATCADGMSQSPIDLDSLITLDSGVDDMSFSYASSGTAIVNNGHTVQFNYDAGSTFTVGADTYDLLQFHFHAGSEHIVDGEGFPMEMHLVHSDSAGNLAVVGVLIGVGDTHPTLSDAGWDFMPTTEGEYEDETNSFNIGDMLPGVGPAWRYSGSLTTPPCSEGVAWHVMWETVNISADQMAVFTDLFDHNYRPDQALNGRTVELGE